MSKNLLVEYVPFKLTPDLVVESKGEKYGGMVVKGVAQRAGVKNQNGRVYSKELLEREVEKYQTLIKENRAYGECDHPSSSIVELKNVSHIVRRTWWEDNDLWVEIEIISENPPGRILENLLKKGLTLGISSRGLGSVKESNEDSSLQVQDDFELICWDFVSNPSTHGSFMKPTTSEGLVLESVNKDHQSISRINSLVTDLICTLSGECPT